MKALRLILVAGSPVFSGSRPVTDSSLAQATIASQPPRPSSDDRSRDQLRRVARRTMRRGW